MENETYLGDAVYASFDGYQIWLRTGDGNNQRIALEPAVLCALGGHMIRPGTAVHIQSLEAG